MFNHRRFSDNSKQLGMSGLGMMTTAAIIVATVVLALRLAPHYIDFQTINSIMADLPSEQIHEMEKRSIIDVLQKRFKINNIRSFLVKDVVSIDRSKVGTDVVVDYEIREPLVGNAEIVLVFAETYSYH
jgi:hypothetical protein